MFQTTTGVYICMILYDYICTMFRYVMFSFRSGLQESSDDINVP